MNRRAPGARSSWQSTAQHLRSGSGSCDIATDILCSADVRKCDGAFLGRADARFDVELSAAGGCCCCAAPRAAEEDGPFLAFLEMRHA